MKVPAAALAALLVLPRVAHAGGDVTIALTPDGQQLASDLGLSPAELETRLETELVDLYDAANVDGFLRSFANATSFASRGVGVDYAPLFRNLELGVTANLAAAAEGLTDGQDPAGGVAPNLTAMLGWNLSRWHHPGWTIYVNGFHRGASLDDFAGTVTNVGAHVQWHAFQPRPSASALIFLWSGVHLTWGVEWSRWNFHLDHAIERSFTVDGNGASSQIDAAADGSFDLSARSVVVPIELTTSARIAYFAGVYLGGGVDVQVGDADAAASLSGRMSGTSPTSGQAVDVGTATVTLDGSQGPSRITGHAIVGVEANVWRAKLFVQTTIVPIKGASLGFGLRVKL